MNRFFIASTDYLFNNSRGKVNNLGLRLQKNCNVLRFEIIHEFKQEDRSRRPSCILGPDGQH